MKRLLTIMMVLGMCLVGIRGMAQPAAAPAAPEKPKPAVKIGAIFAVTGPAAFLGAPEAKSARMLVDKINAQGGVNGHKIELIIKDSAGNPEKAVSFAKQLIEEDKVLAIIGPSTSGETMQIKNLCEENKTILLSCAAAEVIVNPVAKYVFKSPQKDSQAITWIFRSMKERGISKIAVLSSNDGFGNAGKKQLEDMAKSDGIEILVNEVYDKSATDLTDVLTKVKGTAGVQAVVNWSIVPAQSIVAKNLKQIGLDVPLYQSHGFGNRRYIEQAGVAGEGILFPGSLLLVVDELPDTHPQKTILLEYKKQYESEFAEDASAFGGYAFDSLGIVLEGLRKAGTPDREKVRDAIENLKGFAGVTGIYNFSAEDHTGLGLDAFEMIVVKDGKFTIYKK
jgi:branched-chain amino acid transport system substrate-binding protein